MSERIDAHHHLWEYAKHAYPWITGSMRVLQRDFLPDDLERELREQGIAGSIAVQAQQTLDETQVLLRHAETHSFFRGVVGWAPIASAGFPEILDRLCANPKLKGLRHVIQDEPDDAFILREDFNRGIAALQSTGLVYEILIKERHLPQAIAFVDRHPQQAFVLDHVGKPRIAEQVLSPWKENLCELARRDNVSCKLSGMVTEAVWPSWNEASLRPYFEVALEAFGPRRLMVGSDWPVCLLATSYSKWMAVVHNWISELSSHEQEQILGQTAIDVYGLLRQRSPDGKELGK